ncbi:MAG: amidohydrolase [Chloroflexi bacterium]|nr:amidohydrolase [Chloroflexota bacterium]
MAIDFKTPAQALTAEVVARRRDLHQHPEIAFEEVRTAGIVAEELNRLGLEVQTGIGKTGVVGVLEGAQDGPTVLLRADMDALPVQEDNDTDYVSQTPGKMHACGHDGHTAIALGVAKVLAGHREQMAGRVKFVFQPAEEVGSGARAMVGDGVLNDPRPDVTVGLHLWNNMPVGQIGLTNGASMAGSSFFDVKITGKGSHAALPQTGIDPVVCAAHIVTALQLIVSRSLDPLENAVISVTAIHAGAAYNVIPQTAEMRGTIRVMKDEVHDLIVKRMDEIIQNISAALGCTAEFSYQRLTRPVTNDETVAAKLIEAFAPIIGAEAIVRTERTMGAEDVGEFMDDIPGVYFFLGAKDETRDAYYGHHHPRFSFDEAALPLGVELLAAAVAAYVLPEA